MIQHLTAKTWYYILEITNTGELCCKIEGYDIRKTILSWDAVSASISKDNLKFIYILLGINSLFFH